MQALRTSLVGGKTLLSDAEADAVRQSFGARAEAKQKAAAAEAAIRNAAEGEHFLAENKSLKGVFTTPSGLQYMLLRQGAGPRPKPRDRERKRVVQGKSGSVRVAPGGNRIMKKTNQRTSSYHQKQTTN